MPELVSPVQQRQTIMKIRPSDEAGSALKRQVLSHSGPVRTRNRVLSIMRKVARKFGRVRFAYSGQTDHWNP